MFLKTFMCMGVLNTCVYVPCVFLVPREAKKGVASPVFGARDCI